MEVTLRVQGLNIDDETLDEKLMERFPEVVWSDSEGLTLATIFVTEIAAADETMSFVRKLEDYIAGAKVAGVHRDLVSVYDIAQRAGVSREGARKWISIDGFPGPFDYIGAKSMKLWTWTEVLSWLQDTRGFGLGEVLPDANLMTQIENCIMRNPDSTTVQWQQIVSKASSLPPKPAAREFKPAVRVFAGVRAQKADRIPCGLVGADARVATR